MPGEDSRAGSRLGMLTRRSARGSSEGGRPMDDKVAMLRSVPLFVGLDDDELKAVGAVAVEVDKPAGTELAREGTFGTEFYLILEGDVRIDRAGATLRHLGPGDFLGEI